jgi:hypothetical protein
MKLLLVPWSDSFNVILRVYTQIPNRVDDYEAEVSTKNGQKITAELLRKEACSVKPAFLDFFRRVVFEAEVPDAAGGRLLKAFKAVGRFRESVQIPESLVENPSLEKLEKFLREAGAPEYLPPEEVASMEQVYHRLWHEQKPIRIDGGYIVIVPGYNPYYISDDGDVLEVRLPRRMLYEAALYRVCAGRIKLNVRRKANVPANVLSQVARILKEEAPQLLPVILP